MGYTTEFEGAFQLDRPLTPEHKAYLLAFSGSRRMCRDEKLVTNFEDPVREAAGLPIGKDGAYYVGSSDFGQAHDSSIINYNSPGGGQPGLWCQWVPNKEGTAIEWDQGDKFYNYKEWLQYICDHFLKPWGYKLSGNVSWSGESQGDVGVLRIEGGNRVATGEEIDQWSDTGRPDYLATLSADERLVYLAAFGAFSGTEGPGIERAEAAAARGKRAVRWFRELKEQGKL